MDEDKTFTAIYQPSFELNITANNGRVKTNFSYSSSGNKFEANKSVELVATPDFGYQFDG